MLQEAANIACLWVFFPTEIITYLPLVADLVEGNSPSSADCLPLWTMWKTQSGHLSTFMAHPPCQILFGEIFPEQSPSRKIYRYKQKTSAELLHRGIVSHGNSGATVIEIPREVEKNIAIERRMITRERGSHSTKRRLGLAHFCDSPSIPIMLVFTMLLLASYALIGYFLLTFAGDHRITSQRPLLKPLCKYLCSFTGRFLNLSFCL